MDTCPEKTYYIGVGVAATLAGGGVLLAGFYIVKAIKKMMNTARYNMNRIYPDIEVPDSVAAIKFNPRPKIQ